MRRLIGRYMLRAASIALALALAPSAFADVAQTRLAEIPARFHGEWNSDLAKCGDRESGTNLVISANGIAYFEAGDLVIEVHPAELDGINILVDHDDGAGIERLSRTLILSDDQQTLSFTYGDGPEFVALRCPQGTPDGR